MIAIGDIHGCCRTLEGLLEKLEAYAGHELIFVGDYIDRGPCSREVVNLLLELRTGRDCIFLRGNHEQMLLDAVNQGKKSDIKMWMLNGGGQTLNSYDLTTGNLDFPGDHLEFYRDTELYHATDEFLFVHAGAPAHLKLETSMNDPRYSNHFLWSREHLNIYEPPWEKTVIFGHTPRPEPIRRPKRLGIDTGCVIDEPGFGKLTAVVLPEGEFIQQKSLDLK